jgi:predicted lipoprotein with Yx(FWY)xxD motif
MRRISLAVIASLGLALLTITLAGAQSTTSPGPGTSGCESAPAGAVAIVCFGTGSCPSGYIDPVGGVQRGSLYNSQGLFQMNPMVPTSYERFLCQLQTAVQENSGISTVNGSITGPAGSGIVNPTDTTTGGATAQPLTVSTSVTTGSGTGTSSTSTSNSGTSSSPTTSAAAPTPTTSIAVANSAALGSFLTTAQGMTLYEHSGDSTNISTCSGSCAIIWIAFAPPTTNLTAPANATGTLGTMTRDDGSLQVTYNGWPLYTYTGDINAGDTNGSGLANIWSVAKP